ncbi:MAG: NAD-dependent protein deacylase [Clostridiales bacterium]|nr:NAD-dependent protein deacylase [Clostridiales bacterium]
MDKRLEKIIEASNDIVFFGGAGVSTESNIPDFRSEEGLYNAKQEYGKTPEEMISHSFYKNNTAMFFDYYKSNLIYREAKPNKAHMALASLEKEGKLKAIVTQNIDGLHQAVGSKTVYELHGSVMRNYCSKCNDFYSLDFIMDEKNCNNQVPICPKCGGVIKPDVVLYEEALNQEIIENAVKAIASADTLIVGGTSLVVYPAAGLISYFRGKNMVLINKSQTPYDGKADLVINDSIGKVMGD